MLLALFALLFALVAAAAFHLTLQRLICPDCSRELEPDNYTGFLPGTGQFCPYCGWGDDDGI